MQEFEGCQTASGLRIAIIVSRFNESVTEGLLRGARLALRRMSHSEEDLTVLRVPGSFELAQAAQMVASENRYDALICLGALIRGETDHYDHLARTATHAICQVALSHRIPIGFGLLTTHNLQQALNRAGLKHGNKGAEAAQAAVEMAQLKRLLEV